MSRTSLALLVAVAVLGITGPGGCVDADPEVPCASPLDCELRQACRDGACVDQSGEGEGEGEIDEDTAVQGICLRIAQCQGGSPVDCNAQLQAQMDDMRRRGTDVCSRAADAMIEFFTCAQALTCAQLGDPSLPCPVVAQAQQLQEQCFAGEGEGERPGEGEGEGE